MQRSVIGMVKGFWTGWAIGLLACLPFIGLAQHTLNIRLTGFPKSHSEDPVFITGNFNGWDPAAQEMQLQRLEDGTMGIQIALGDVPSDRLEFKFTRGDWSRSECTREGRLVGPRIANLNRDTTICCQIEGWRDDFPASTASPNVHLLDSAFYMPQLDRYRKVWIYLPEGYASGDQRYPVMYMQDGQHLFDEATSQGRIGPIEWGVDETIDRALRKSIVVAINHRDDYRDREPEFYYHPNSNHPAVEGPEYLRFVVETLKPYVDRHYRTLPEQRFTAMAGSSLGGLLTLYAGLHYPEVFGILGVFSPSVWMDEGNIDRELAEIGAERKTGHAGHAGHAGNRFGSQRYYFYAGKQENRRKADGNFVRMHEDVVRIMDLLREAVEPAEVTYAENPDGRHGALHWRTAFPGFYEWFAERATDKTSK